MVFQNYALYPHMSVRQNMGFALKMAGPSQGRDRRAPCARAAAILRITEHLDKRPKQLSGGQKQRVAIGRAITRAPEVFLFDEPLSNLDAALRSQMRVELGRLHAELEATMVYVTHDQTEAMTMADRIVVLNDGVIEQIGSPLELYNRPANRFVAGFLGSPRMNFIAARAGAVERPHRGRRGARPRRPLPLAIEPGAALPQPGDDRDRSASGRRACARTAGALTVDARVVVVESLGRETLLYVDAAPLAPFEFRSQRRAISRCTARRRSSPATATACRSRSPRDAVYLFDRDGSTLR